MWPFQKLYSPIYFQEIWKLPILLNFSKVSDCPLYLVTDLNSSRTLQVISSTSVQPFRKKMLDNSMTTFFRAVYSNPKSSREESPR